MGKVEVRSPSRPFVCGTLRTHQAIVGAVGSALLLYAKQRRRGLPFAVAAECYSPQMANGPTRQLKPTWHCTHLATTSMPRPLLSFFLPWTWPADIYERFELSYNVDNLSFSVLPRDKIADRVTPPSAVTIAI